MMVKIFKRCCHRLERSFDAFMAEAFTNLESA